MGYRCIFEYGDGHQCTYRGCDREGEMCSDHALITDERLKKITKRPEILWTGEKRAHDTSEFHDPTTPWRCRDVKCKVHEGKPTYHEYFFKKYGKEPSLSDG